MNKKLGLSQRLAAEFVAGLQFEDVESESLAEAGDDNPEMLIVLCWGQA